MEGGGMWINQKVRGHGSVRVLSTVYNSLEVLYTPMLDEFLSIWHKKLSWYRIQQKVKCLNFIEGYFSSFA